jgi:hypothetical protein
LGCITTSIIPLDKILEWGMIILCCTAAHFAEEFESKGGRYEHNQEHSRWAGIDCPS